MTDLAELVVRIKADASQLQSELRNATETTKQSASAMGSALATLKEQFTALLPAITIASIVEFGKSALESASQLYDLAQRTGFAASTLSALNIPLKQNGSSVDEFSSSIKFLNRNIELAVEGNQELIQRFDGLGLSVSKLKSLSPEQQFYAVASALGDVTDQGKLTADILTLMGRGAAGLIPLIKETNGNLQEFVENAKKAGDAITDEQIQKVHEWDAAWVSAWEHMKIGAVDAVTALNDFFSTEGKGIYTGESRAQIAARHAAEIGPYTRSTLSVTTPDVPDYVAPGGTAKFDGAGNIVNPDPFFADTLKVDPKYSGKSNPASGSNNDLQTSKNALADNAVALQQQAEDYDQLTGTVDDFVRKLQQQNDVLSASKDQSAAMKAVYEAQNIATKDGELLTEEQINQIKQLAAANDNLKQSQQDSAHVARQMQDAFANSIDQVISDFHNLQSAVASVMQAIASEIIRTQISQPLAKGLGGILGNFNFGSLFGGGSNSTPAPATLPSLEAHADGGVLTPGVPSLVGERGPELLIPNMAATVIPNHQLGGSVNVTNVFNLSPGLQETVATAIQNAAPVIRDSAINGTLAAIQQGGAAARVAGRKN